MPRKAPHLAPHRRHRRRFNEAGAVMPRKTVRPSSPSLLRPRFNEAGAVMPRKRDDHFAPVETVDASMRPGLLCPGSELPYAGAERA